MKTFLSTLSLLLLAGSVASAQPVPTGQADEAPAEVESSQDPGRVLSTAGRAVVPRFRIWESEQFDAFIKPVIQISSSAVAYFPNSETNDELVRARVSTLLLARLGFEGQLFKYVTFRTLFERNMGFSLANGGPIGTSIWEGMASLQARENYIRLERWGVQLTGGIFPDPASVDFVATDTLDLFGMDPYVRDPLLLSGFNQGQGFMARYKIPCLGERVGGKLDVGLSFSAGNPLTSSLSLGFGGEVSTFGTLFFAPLRGLSVGIPGTDIQMHVLSPSATWSSPWVDVRATTQFYFIDNDISESEDVTLRGYNARVTFQVKPWDTLRVFGSFAYRENEQIQNTDLTMRLPDFQGIVAAAGAEYRLGDFSVGGQYYWIRQDRNENALGEEQVVTTQYAAVGVSYYLWSPNVSVGLRWSFNTFNDTTREELSLKSTNALIFSMRLLI